MESLLCNADFQTWSELYFTQLFTTLGQLTAVVVTGAVAVPVANYYNMLWTKKSN